MLPNAAFAPARPRNGQRLHDAHFATVLLSGGDERIAIDPSTGRNRYGLSPRPAPGEAFFSSSTASAISPAGWNAAAAAWRRLSPLETGASLSIGAWFDEIRGRIAGHAGPGALTILSASGTDTELVTLAIACAHFSRPVTNIVVGPAETGRGVPLAANGSRFLPTSPFGGEQIAGRRIAGWEDFDIHVDTVEIREPNAGARAAAEIDHDVMMKARAALAEGRGLIVHLLDVSKTGLSGLTHEAAQEICAWAPDRVLVVADCCQMRSSMARLRDFVESGFLVSLTGSKFFGGPPFSGALLVPGGVVERLDGLGLPNGLTAHSALYDWPDNIRRKMAGPFASHMNLGLGLRWEAALAEMDRFQATSTALAQAVRNKFRDRVEACARGIGLTILPHQDGQPDWAGSIVSIAVRHRDGTPFSAEWASALQKHLRSPSGGKGSATARIFHVGQPVAVGKDQALRICLSAPMVSDVALRVSQGFTFDQALAPLVRDIEALFAKWKRLFD